MRLIKNIEITIREFLNENYSNDVWYHGGESKISKFKKTPPVNRNGNVEGYYFTKFLEVAMRYGEEITKVKLKIKKPFILSKSLVTDNMIEVYRNVLHDENPDLPKYGDWIEGKCQYFKNNSIMPYTGLNGYLQQKVFKAGLFDSVIDGHEIAVFNSEDIIVLN